MFTKEEVMAALRKAVEMRGEDYVYPEGWKHPMTKACYYAHQGKPACIVGQVVAILDEDAFARLAKAEQWHGTEIVTGLRNYDPEDPDFQYLPRDFWEQDAEYALDAAQKIQDHGHTWGEALATAEDYQ